MSPGVAGTILEDADARIRQYRTGRIELHLTDSTGNPLPAGIEVSIKQRRHAFGFGSNIYWLSQSRPKRKATRYKERFAALFNTATLPFYWAARQPAPDRFDFTPVKHALDWCQENGIAPKGHPLAWNSKDPEWLEGTPQVVMEAQWDYLKHCLQRFQDDITDWDVVNEATYFNRPATRRFAPYLTQSIKQIGVVEYVRKAFRLARKEQPGASLVINDYATGNAFADRILSQLVDANGSLLFDAIGIQAHQHRQAWSPKQIWQVCERFRRFGKPIHFTEVTLPSGRWRPEPKNDSHWETSPRTERAQARKVLRFYKLLFSHPTVEAIIWWDFSDADAWRGAPAGLLRSDMSPKPAYHALEHLIKTEWWTEKEKRLRGDSSLQFRGFYGDYRITARQNGKTLEGRFHHSQSRKGKVHVTLN